MTTSRTTTASVSKARSASKEARITRFALALSTALTPMAAIADTLPTGGVVTHGAATIGAPNAGSMTIDQSSNRAVVNWNDFSIGAGNQVNINQPSADAAILNRVTGDTTSAIHGQLNANGRVFVVNPNGIFIGKTGAINTGSFVASTLGIRSDDFINGKTVFEGNGSSATVVNEGTVQVVTGGYAALIGGQVSNKGAIQAPMGFVGLGSGERITLDLGGDGFMQVAIPTDTDDPELKALIENAGTIQANGGTVQLSAATARDAARRAINMSGVVEARTVSGRNGRITLGGGGGGTVAVTGKLRSGTKRPTIQVTQSARPKMPPARGGDITVTGREITLAGADIDASGTDGGGNIRIGGEYQGGPGLPTADTLSADATTVITADAIETGDGGRVILWSDIYTDFSGNISIRGGDASGNGGFAEVSGKQTLRYAGSTDSRAPNGDWGTLLLDPNDIDIIPGAAAGNNIQASQLEADLELGNVIVDTSSPPGGFEPGLLTVFATANLTWGASTTLTLNADDDAILNSTITPGAGGGLVVNSDNRAVINGTIEAAGADVAINGFNEVALAGSGTINGNGSTINLYSFNGDVTIDGEINAPASNVSLGTYAPGSGGSGVGYGQVFIDTPGQITTPNGTLTITTPTVDVLGTITSNQSTNNIFADVGVSVSGTLEATQSNTTIVADSGVILDGTILVTDGTLGITSGGATDLIADLDGVGADITVASTDDVTLTGDVINAGGTFTVGASGVAAEILPTGAVNTGTFVLTDGDWVQNAALLPALSADNFVIQGGSFLRVTGGDGTGVPFQVTDVFGLQGVGTTSAPFVIYELANNIDLAPAQLWSALDTPSNGVVNSGFVPFDMNGVLRGNGNTISNLFVRQYGAFDPGAEAGLFASMGPGAGVFDTNIVNANITGPVAGVVAGFNSGQISGVTVSGAVGVYDNAGGGIVGINEGGSVQNSRSSVGITDAVDPSFVVPPVVPSIRLGGIAGTNSGSISRVASEGSVLVTGVTDAIMGGVAGLNTAASRIRIPLQPSV